MKKRILALLMSAAMALSLTACSKSGGSEEPGRSDKDKGSDSSDSSKGYKIYPNEDDFEIEECDGGVAIVYYYDYTKSELEIPPTIGGKKVVKIGQSAIQCSAESITIPKSVTKIDSGAFNWSTWFNIKREENPLVVVNNILIYADYEKCSGSVTVPEGVTYIAEGAFQGCKGITSITLPDGLTEIGSNAFKNCESLTSITIPESVNEIGDGAFSGTPWFESKRKESPLIINNVLVDGSGCSGSYTIPQGVTKIRRPRFPRLHGAYKRSDSRGSDQDWLAGFLRLHKSYGYYYSQKRDRVRNDRLLGQQD